MTTKSSRRVRIGALAFVLAAALVTPAAAGSEYTCKDGRVEKSGSTIYTVRRAGADIYIEKSGGTRGKAVPRGSGYAVEISGSTQATIEDGKIFKSGSTWTTVEEARRKYDCDPVVAATLWVLDQLGAL